MNGRRRVVRIVVGALAIVVAHSAIGQSRPASVVRTPGPVPREYWGLHIHRADSLATWPAHGVGSWRLWDARVAWPNLEPARGQWRFDALDRYVEVAQAHGAEILLPLAMSPTWASARPAEISSYSLGATAEPADLRDWRRYVETVARRYQGRVRHYEIWNEPNLKAFYTGSVATMVDLAREAYTTLKAVDPTIVVVSPAPTERPGLAWLEEYLKRGGAKYADVIGYHFYVAPAAPEAMVPLILDVRDVLFQRGIDKPVWNTESGWLIASQQKPVKAYRPHGLGSRVMDDEGGAAYVARSYVLSWAFGVSRLYWYAWDNYQMGLIEPDGRTVKPAGQAYDRVRDWITGSELKECSSAPRQPWTCRLVRAGGDEAWIAWSANGPAKLVVPATWRVSRLRELGGGVRSVSNGDQVALGALPVLLER